MKKVFAILLALTAVSVVISGCSGGEKAAEGGDAAAPAAGGEKPAGE